MCKDKIFNVQFLTCLLIQTRDQKHSHSIFKLPFLQGIIFSLNARKSRKEYISLELKEGRLELVHSLPNGSNIIDIPAKIIDGKWHQLAIRYKISIFTQLMGVNH